MELSDRFQIANFIHRHFRNPFEMSRLRSALSTALYGLTRYTDDDIVREVVFRLLSGVWQVAYEEEQSQTVSGDVARKNTSYMPARTASPPPSRPTPPPVLQPAPMRTLVQAAAPSAEWPEVIDQLALARVLKKCALSATPCYERCGVSSPVSEGDTVDGND